MSARKEGQIRRILLALTAATVLALLGRSTEAQVCYEERYQASCDDCYMIGSAPCTTCIYP